MGSLTPYLQREFATTLPPGWAAAAEVPLLSDESTALLGYDPRADVLLTHAATGTRDGNGELVAHRVRPSVGEFDADRRPNASTMRPLSACEQGTSGPPPEAFIAPL